MQLKDGHPFPSAYCPSLFGAEWGAAESESLLALRSLGDAAQAMWILRGIEKEASFLAGLASLRGLGTVLRAHTTATFFHIYLSDFLGRGCEWERTLPPLLSFLLPPPCNFPAWRGCSTTDNWPFSFFALSQGVEYLHTARCRQEEGLV